MALEGYGKGGSVPLLISLSPDPDQHRFYYVIFEPDLLCIDQSESLFYSAYVKVWNFLAEIRYQTTHRQHRRQHTREKKVGAYACALVDPLEASLQKDLVST